MDKVWDRLFLFSNIFWTFTSTVYLCTCTHIFLHIAQHLIFLFHREMLALTEDFIFTTSSALCRPLALSPHAFWGRSLLRLQKQIDHCICGECRQWSLQLHCASAGLLQTQEGAEPHRSAAGEHVRTLGGPSVLWNVASNTSRSHLTQVVTWWVQFQLAEFGVGDQVGWYQGSIFDR